MEELGATAADFEEIFGEMHFVFHHSAGVEVPFEKRGAQRKVTFKNAAEFAQKVLEIRLTEAIEPAAIIHSGMAMMIPIGCLSLWSWHDLQLKVCGNPFVDVAA
eukprot:NODE_9221_length_1439_cov_3.647104.p2 GENE.NODE_9221_length_1439_cov_3.647104~~NODE_9221_length_1439_cov_3.647104.p2  ORF type:complete len:104 (+),score=40.01 NODE_9221_length_1439_cov_3.647104:288-599(+)